MQIENITTPGQASPLKSALATGADKIKEERAQASSEGLFQADTQDKEKQVQSEEMLQNIKALTDGGMYSVRFEMHKDTNEMVISLVEQETGEKIRQIPPDEIIGLRQTLENLRGNLLETQS